MYNSYVRNIWHCTRKGNTQKYVWQFAKGFTPLFMHFLTPTTSLWRGTRISYRTMGRMSISSTRTKYGARLLISSDKTRKTPTGNCSHSFQGIWMGWPHFHDSMLEQENRFRFTFPVRCRKMASSSYFKIISFSSRHGALGIVVVKALYYKLEGRGFKTRGGKCIFSIYVILPAALGPQSLTEVSTRSGKIMFLRSKTRPVRRADKFTIGQHCLLQGQLYFLTVYHLPVSLLFLYGSCLIRSYRPSLDPSGDSGIQTVTPLDVYPLFA
jgi:hypothetical protein